ncbi:MAG TPA: prolyl oligopeptidase family serine peptidase [Vicinamibacterales bacterium]|nr:prolyl oligopeptidase family serine peptidase [Vicinamibacterales bacterium]
MASQGVRLGSVAVDGDDVYWLERRPNEGGRSVLVRRRADGRREELTPQGFNVRTRVHEYGGGAYIVAGGDIYFSNFSDQRIYRGASSAGSKEQDPAYAVTPANNCFYADFAYDSPRNRLIAVREDHGPAEAGHYKEPETTMVAIPLDGGENAGAVIASGHDFYSTPRISPDGARLAWLSWRHPQMPWDGTELWVADIDASGDLSRAELVAGGPSESIYQPGWSPEGTLCFVSDRDGWWKLYRWDGSLTHAVMTNAPPGAEFGRPQWICETATWAFAGRSRIVVSYTKRGRWHLGVVNVASGVMTSLAPGLEPREWLRATETHAIVVAGSARTSDAVMQIDLDTGEAEPLKTASAVEIDPAYISDPDAIEFPTSRGLTAHAFVYPPRHPEYTGTPGARPPLIVISHGGPTTATTARFDVAIQYWTTRGFAVADVNYGGSSGYGRPYRERLNGQWGIVDVEDAVNAARHMVAQGKADPQRLIIRGGSAGGYTALAALVFHPGVFKAAASYYGISDIEVLAHDTHKFESRYLDTLIGPYPEARELYRARSPIHFVDRLSCALILLQGLEDKVVPPNQSEMMADAVRKKGLPVAYLSFEGEQHGFRKATTIIRSLEAELYFYGAVFGFTPADTIEPLPIDNL